MASAVNDRLWVFFGKSCAGKSYVASAFAHHLGATMIEGDAYLTEAMKQSLRNEQPFTDAMRSEYYAELATVTRGLLPEGRGVLAQAFFKRTHRDAFRAAFPGAIFVHVAASDALIHARATSRRNHLVRSAQYPAAINALFELPPDEPVITYLNVSPHVDCERILRDGTAVER